MISVATLVVLFWFSPARAGTGDDFRGYSWNEHVGWMSWNCTNLTSCKQVDYGVKFSGSDIVGWIWSENVGWICMGKTCADTVPALPAPSGETRAWLDDAGAAHGWARIAAFDDHGWISLNCVDLGVCGASNFAVTADRATGEVRGWGWNGNVDGTGIGWVGMNCTDQGVCGASNYYVTFATSEKICNNALDDDLDNAADCRDSDCAGKVGGIAGQLCGPETAAASNCTDSFDNDADGFSDCADPDCHGIDPACPSTETGLCTNGRDDDVDGTADCRDTDCASDPACLQPETNCVDGIDNNFNGQIDCQDSDCAVQCAIGKCKGSGDPCLRQAECPTPDQCVVQAFSFLQTQNGSLYTRGGFSADRFPPENKYNATACLLTSQASISNFTSDPSGACTSPQTPSARTLPSPDAFSYGASQPGPINPVLGGAVYHFPGDLTITSPIVFQNGSGNVSGAGLVVVDGDLTISADLTYAGGSIAKLRDLASVGWLVRGNVIIDPKVTNIVGAFYIQGNLRTGGGADPLTIRGQVIATQIHFDRDYKDLTRGSELVVLDGRAIANPPPGFTDANATLPTWEAVAP